jgi:hypothetical protein
MWIEMHSLMAADWVDAATAAEKGERGEEEEKRGGAERGEYEDAFLCVLPGEGRQASRGYHLALRLS